MTNPRSRFKTAYRDALVAYVSGPDEEGRSQAYELGRQAVTAEMSLLELAGVHTEVLRQAPPGLDLSTPKTAILAMEFFAESLTTFDMAQRGFWDAQERARTEAERRVKGQRLAEAYLAVTTRRALDERLADIRTWAARLVNASDAEIHMLAIENSGKSDEASGPGVTDGPVADRVLLDVPGRYGVPIARLTVWTSALEPADADVLEQFARMAGVAIEGALLFERDHALAVTLQRSLLPTELVVPEPLTVAVRYVPAGLEGEVGGDWYDVITLDDRRVVLVVGDVVGHGVGQAAIMGQLRFALRAYAVEGHAPDQTAGRLDQLLRSLPEAPSATVLYVGVDLGSRGVSVLNAGHPPPVIIQPSRQARFLDIGRAGLLGVTTDTSRAVHGPTELMPGTLLLLYTDGLLEATERDGSDGFGALLDVFRDFEGGPEQLCDTVMDAFIDGAPTDDVCLLAARIG